MTNRGKVIKGLSEVVAELQEEVDDWEGFSDDELRGGTTVDCNWFYNVFERCKDALDLLKAQEPRVMALEEVHALNNGDVVWLEFRGDLCVCAGIFHKVDMLITDMSFETMGGTIFPDIHNGYNVRWRCWNCKPTDEQRKEVEWNG